MATLLVAHSCTTESKPSGQRAVTAKVQSAPYELLVVADKEWLKTEAGQRLVGTVEAPIEGLPQIEPQFRVTYINPFAFNNTFKTYANIVVAEVSSKHKKVEVAARTNVYARPQVVLYVYAPTNEAFAECMSAYGPKLLQWLNANEFSRERSLLKRHHSGVVTTQAQKLLGVSIDVPKDIDEVKPGRNFLWASAGKQEFRQNVCLYTLPLQPVTAERFVALRDSTMKVNIPGGRPDQWMETDVRTVMADTLTVDGRQVLTVRGLWDMRNDAMGGPFVCYVYPDSARQRLLMAEGFVFAPEEKKRPIIRQLEAALQSLQFVGNTHK